RSKPACAMTREQLEHILRASAAITGASVVAEGMVKRRTLADGTIDQLRVIGNGRGKAPRIDCEPTTTISSQNEMSLPRGSQRFQSRSDRSRPSAWPVGSRPRHV